MNSSHIPRILALLLLAAFLLSIIPAAVIADEEEETTEAFEIAVDPIAEDQAQETEQASEAGQEEPVDEAAHSVPVMRI